MKTAGVARIWLCAAFVALRRAKQPLLQGPRPIVERTEGRPRRELVELTIFEIVGDNLAAGWPSVPPPRVALPAFHHAAGDPDSLN
jgi:hypothetical protein